MLEMLKDLLGQMAGDDEIFDLMAKCYKKTFDALVKQGFTDAQALEIISKQGLGMKQS